MVYVCKHANMLCSGLYRQEHEPVFNRQEVVPVSSRRESHVPVCNRQDDVPVFNRKEEVPACKESLLDAFGHRAYYLAGACCGVALGLKSVLWGR